MTVAVGASLLPAIAMGLLTIAALGWPSGLRGHALAGFLALGIGLGVSSSIFFAWLWVAGAPDPRFPVAELLVLGLLAGVVVRARIGRRSRAVPARAGPAGLSLPPALALALALSAACALFAFLVESATNRQGGWDAWMTWNMHARAILRGGDHWREVLVGLPAWSHPDYPLLVPGSIARIWTYLGRETALAQVAVPLVFTLATAGVLYAAVARLGSPTGGALATMLLLGTKFFILHGASQFADIPLAFFFLATLTLLSLAGVWSEDRPRLLALAGLTAGLAGWTKNEGLLFLLAVLAVYGGAEVRARGWRAALGDGRAFAAGAAPVLVMILCFKLWLAPPNDLMADQGLRVTAARLLDGTRWYQVLAGFWRAFLEVGARGLTGLLLLLYWLVAGPAASLPVRRVAKTAALVVLLTLAGYGVVLLTAPDPLLQTNIRSVNRLLLQLWPSMLLAYFVGVRAVEESGVPEPALPGAAPSGSPPPPHG